MLFGLLPAVMAWRQREAAAVNEKGNRSKQPFPSHHMKMLPGGRPILIAIGLVAVVVIMNQAISHGTQVAATLRTMA